ncbi:MAG: hypothetical protein AAF604_00945 [Acidobacteriota bacterium]
MKPLHQPSRLALLGVALLGLTLRALVPIGFMPASLSEGLPVKICPAHAAGLMPMDPAAPAQGEDSSQENHCPLGATFNAAFEPSSNAPGPALVSLQRVALPTPVDRSDRRSGTLPARGPPAPLTSSA